MRAIHPFPARMAPEAVSKWIEALPRGSRVLDPMCGSGVVLRQAAQLGHTAVGFDVDPLAVLMSRVWTRKGDHSILIDVAQEVARNAKRRRADFQSLPTIRHCQETQDFVRYWFAEPQRSQLARLALAINDLEGTYPLWMLDGMRICLSRTIVTKHTGASLAWDVPHSRPHKKRDTNDYDVVSGFLLSVEKLANILDTAPTTRSAEVCQGDCRNLRKVKTETVDAIITSPPYLNALDYLRGHKLSLVWLGYTIPELRKIRASSVGTEKAGDSWRRSGTVGAELEFVVPNISRLPNRQRAIVHKYATDANLMLQEMKRVIKPKGKVILVLADSLMRGIEIQSSTIFSWLAKRQGLIQLSTEIREIPHTKRYLPIRSSNPALQKRMHFETIQAFENTR